MNSLTKKEALKLLPAVVDNEATENEVIAFLDYIEDDEEVQLEFKSALKIKRLVTDRYPRKSAPKHLREKILKLIGEESARSDFEDQPSDRKVDDLTKSATPTDKKAWRMAPMLRYLAAAAVILFITLTTIEFLDRTEINSEQHTELLEHYTALHFTNASGKSIEPHFSTTSTIEAEAYIRDHHGIEMTIPDIEGAEFAGLVMAEFYNGLKTPLLGYTQHQLDENIYIFAFQMEKLKNHQSLERSSDAVESCKTNTDFHVAEVSGHHVVSWLWDDIWYSAVSNHNGYDLASLVEPLNYSP